MYIACLVREWSRVGIAEVSNIRTVSIFMMKSLSNSPANVVLTRLLARRFGV
jgi:hypothetical protein